MRSLDFKDVICVGCHMDVIVFLIPIKKWSRGPDFIHNYLTRRLEE